MKILNSAVVLSVSMGLLAGCGGSNGGGGGNNIFSSFSNIPDDGTTDFVGTSRSTSFTADGAGLITSISPVSGPDDATAAVRTEGGDVSAININAPGANASFDRNNGDTFDSDGTLITAESANGEDFLAIVDNEAAGFEYQTFGAWLTGFNTSSGNVGVGSFGARTASSSVPSGTATYNGGSVGFAVDGGGNPYVTGSDVTVSTDFSTASISSTNTMAENLNTGVSGGAGGIDFSGSGPVSGSGFTASVATGGSSQTGSADGQFYGPSAQEVGGTFALEGNGISYIGSFGGNQ